MGEQDGGLSSDGGTAAAQPGHRPVPYFPPPPTGLTMPFLSPELPVPAEIPPSPPAAPAGPAAQAEPAEPAEPPAASGPREPATGPHPHPHPHPETKTEPEGSAEEAAGRLDPPAPVAGAGLPPADRFAGAPGVSSPAGAWPAATRPSPPAGSHVPLTLAAPVAPAPTAPPIAAAPPAETEPKAPAAADRTPEPTPEPTPERTSEPAPEPIPEGTPGRSPEPQAPADAPGIDEDDQNDDDAKDDEDASPGDPPVIEILELVEGRIRIEDEVIEKIAVLAALEVDGVAALSGHPAGLHDAGGRAHRRARAIVQDNEVTVDLVIAVSYGSVVMDVARLVKTNVARVVSGMLGIKVRAVNVTIDDVRMPAGPMRPDAAGPQHLRPEPARSAGARPVRPGGH